jgi:hypothetical protein
MSQRVFDEVEVRSAMRDYLQAAERLDESAVIGAEARTLLDLAEQKTMAELVLRKALVRNGWTPPTRAVEGCATA